MHKRESALPVFMAAHRAGQLPARRALNRLRAMFEARLQTFDDHGERAASAERLAALRAELKRRGLDGFIVPRADRHQNEYVPPSEERLAWLTGFTGSAGAAIVLADRAVIFVDGRYVLQVRDQIDTALFAVEHLVDNPPDKWLETNLPAGARFGYDPWLHTADGAEKLAKACTAAGATLVPAEPNPIDSVWADRPAPPLGRVVVHDLKFAGEAAAEKLARVQAEIGKLKADALDRLRSAQRRLDLQHPRRGRLAHAAAARLRERSEARAGRALYIDGRKLSNEVRDYLETLADVREPGAFADDLEALGAAKATVRLDSATAADALSRAHRGRGRHGRARRRSDHADEGGRRTRPRSPARAPRMRATARRSRTSSAWFDREAPSGKLTEIDAVAALESFRRDTGVLKELSFPTISGAGPNGAIVHYRVTRATNRAIAPGELFLLDSGAQYQDGTTDITRTIAVGDADGRDARPLHPRAQGPHRDRARGVSRRHHRRAARLLRAPVPLGRRHRLRSRHRPRRRQLSSRCTRARRASPSSAPRRSSAA